MTNIENHELSPADIQDALLAVLEGDVEDYAAERVIAQVQSVRSFYEGGVMTRDAGVVLRLGDGSEFQISIVRSR